MKYGMLGRTDLEVSRVGLGTVEIGLPYGIGLPDPPPDDECIRLLHAALDRGITYFDTAAGYGRSEELVGKALSGMGSSRPVIATKVKLRASASGPELEGAELSEQVCNSVRESIATLGADSLDLVQVYGRGGYLPARGDPRSPAGDNRVLDGKRDGAVLGGDQLRPRGCQGGNCPGRAPSDDPGGLQPARPNPRASGPAGLPEEGAGGSAALRVPAGSALAPDRKLSPEDGAAEKDRPQGSGPGG